MLITWNNDVDVAFSEARSSKRSLLWRVSQFGICDSVEKLGKYGSLE